MVWWRSSKTAEPEYEDLSNLGATDAGAEHDESQLYSLKYGSVLTDPENADATLAAIIASALKNNAALGITGMMYYDRRTQEICQILEGPQKQVLSLYEIIANDERHQRLVLIEQRPIAERSYADFGMALARTADSEQMRLAKQSSAQPDYSEHLVRLQYTSTLVASNAEEAKQLVREILAVAVRKNSEQRIGGLLCFNPTTLSVTQLLEGPAGAVRDLFLLIMSDPRHTGCVLTSEELLLSQADYLFGASWGMLQSETADAQPPLLLPSTIRKTYHANAANTALEEVDSGNALGVVSTPTTMYMME